MIAIGPAGALQAPQQRQDWNKPNFRACERCNHGKTGACTNPNVAGRGRRVSFAEARRLGGACGPEAEHLDFPGLRA